MSTEERLRGSIEILLTGDELDQEAIEQAFIALTDESFSPVLKASFLTALRAKGVTAGELAALARAMLSKAAPVQVESDVLVDTCGTGGDGSNSVNISTAAALLLAAGGIPIAKHGNRSVSSRAGSADLIEALDIPFAGTPEEGRRSLLEHGFAFLFAPAFHAATAAVVPVRRALGIRTVFNVLGPLVNPARPTHQLTGTGSPEVAACMAGALARLDVERAFVVRGADNWDEATPVGPFHVLDVHAGRVSERTHEPAEYGIERCTREQLVGGDAAHNARIIRAVLGGDRAGDAQHVRGAIVLNAALALQLTGHEEDPRAAAERVGEVIDRGAATALLDGLRASGVST